MKSTKHFLTLIDKRRKLQIQLADLEAEINTSFLNQRIETAALAQPASSKPAPAPKAAAKAHKPAASHKPVNRVKAATKDKKEHGTSHKSDHKGESKTHLNGHKAPGITATLVQILTDAGKPVPMAEITEKMHKHFPDRPAANLKNQISVTLATNKKHFHKTGRGIYALVPAEAGAAA